MMRRAAALLLVAAVLAAACSRKPPAPADAPEAAQPVLSEVGADSRAFTVVSADGTEITGQVDAPFGADGHEPVIVLSAGTGLFDRDVRLGKSGTERDAVFADLARRFTGAGIATVRYDRRGVRYRPADGQVLDKVVSGTSTVGTQRDDLFAVYALAREEFGGQAACVALLGHSEGMPNIAEIAAAGGPVPSLVVGIGAPLQAPAAVFKWQLTERDAFSLRMMDENADGTVTTREVERGWRETPSAVFNMVEPFRHPSGRWTPEDIDNVVVAQTQLYEQTRADALAMDDTAPYPDANTPMAAYSWWKHWYTDEAPIAGKLAVWDMPILLYYGTKDSQVRYEFQQPAAAEALSGRAEIHILPGLGHSLGPDVLTGPMDDAAANALVARTAAILKERCAP